MPLLELCVFPGKMLCLWILFFIEFAVAQQKSCYNFVGTVLHTVPGAFPHCDYVNSHYGDCAAGPTTALNACVCNQKVFNEIYG